MRTQKEASLTDINFKHGNRVKIKTIKFKCDVNVSLDVVRVGWGS